MTSTNTGPQPTITNDIPHEVWLNWRESHAAATRADDIESILPTLDEKIAKAQAELDFLKSEHKRAGRDITEHRRRSDTYREMVELWCAKHARHLPPELTAADLHNPQPPAPPQGQPPALPPGVEPVRDPGLAAEVPGRETTQTVIDALGGGDAESLGTFQPRTRPEHEPQHEPRGEEGNGERGESRA